MNILIDKNIFDFLLENIDKIDAITKKHNLFYILSQEIELENMKNSKNVDQIKRYEKMKQIKGDYCIEEPGPFMLNAPCINRKCIFPSNFDFICKTLKDFGCHKNNRLENFNHDLNIAITAYNNGYTVLTNDGSKSNKGLYNALKKLNIKCLSHDEFKNLI